MFQSKDLDLGAGATIDLPNPGVTVDLDPGTAMDLHSKTGEFPLTHNFPQLPVS
jgi:hypothetical protein